jgi:hypothetical protein
VIGGEDQANVRARVGLRSVVGAGSVLGATSLALDELSGPVGELLPAVGGAALARVQPRCWSPTSARIAGPLPTRDGVAGNRHHRLLRTDSRDRPPLTRGEFGGGPLGRVAVARFGRSCRTAVAGCLGHGRGRHGLARQPNPIVVVARRCGRGGAARRPGRGAGGESVLFARDGRHGMEWLGTATITLLLAIALPAAMVRHVNRSTPWLAYVLVAIAAIGMAAAAWSQLEAVRSVIQRRASWSPLL